MNEKPNRYHSLWICAILAAATAAVYFQVRTYDFVNYDDNEYVYKNPNIQAGITPESVKWAFTTGHSANWHPLTWVSLMLDWQFYDNHAGGYHLTNLIFHIINTILLFLVLKQMTNAVWQSAFVAALFALHPLHVESVAWIAERKDVLSMFFWILTMWAYAKYCFAAEALKQTPTTGAGANQKIKIQWYLLVVVFLALGLMSKPMLVTIPCVLLLLDYWPLGRLNSVRSLAHLVIEKIPLFAIIFLSSVITFIVQQKFKAVMSASVPLKICVLNAICSYLKYILKMIWPAELAMFYPYPKTYAFVSFAVLSAIVLVFITILVLIFSKKHRYLFTGWFWYIGTLVPVIGIIQVGSQAMADRYTYIPLTGLFIIIAWGASELLEKWRYRKAFLWTASLIILAALARLTNVQQQYWKDTITLCTHALEVTKDNYEAHFCMAAEYLYRGDYEQAIVQAQEASRIDPQYASPLITLGNAYYKLGKFDKSVEFFDKAIKAEADNAEIYINYGLALTAAGRFEKAVSVYRKGLEIEPDNSKLLNNLGMVLNQTGKPLEAAKEYEKILKAEPQNAAAHNNLGNALAASGKLDDAVKEYEKVLNLDPGNLTVLTNLCTILLEQGKADEAVKQYRKYLQVKPDSPAVFNALGLILFQMDKTDEASKYFTETLRLAPETPGAHYRLGQILAQKGEIDSAVSHLEEAIRLEPNWVEPMNDLAWYLAVKENIKAHNPQRAIKLSQRVCELTNFAAPQLLDTLAAAYAAAGDFEKAIEITQKGIELCKSPQSKAVKDELEKRLVLYKAGKPYTEK